MTVQCCISRLLDMMDVIISDDGSLDLCFESPRGFILFNVNRVYEDGGTVYLETNGVDLIDLNTIDVIYQLTKQDWHAEIRFKEVRRDHSIRVFNIVDEWIQDDENGVFGKLEKI